MPSLVIVSKRCSDCKYWGEPVWPEEQVEFRTCHKIGHSPCEIGGPIRAYIGDRGEHSPSLVTSEDFGCILWKPSDELQAFEVSTEMAHP